MKNPNMPMTREGNLPNMDMDENTLLTEIKNSIVAMQQQMQDTYAALGETEVIGLSQDGQVEVRMTATYKFKGVKINPRSLADANGKFSPKDFEARLAEALEDLSNKIQKTTQNKTLELLQGMDIPEDIRNISLRENEGK